MFSFIVIKYILTVSTIANYSSYYYEYKKTINGANTASILCLSVHYAFRKYRWNVI